MWPFKKKEVKQDTELKAILRCLERQEEVEIKLSIRALVMYEALSGNNFSASASKEDMFILMYCAFVCSTGYEISIEAFQEMLEDEKFAKKLDRDLARLQRFSEQFKAENVSKEDKSGGKNVNEVSITEMADKLIFAYGIDPEYVLNKMQLWELTHFLKGAESHYKERMEEQRMWTFLQVAPQIDLKKCKSPEKYLPLPWEKEDKRKRQEKELEKETARAKQTLGMEIHF